MRYDGISDIGVAERLKASRTLLVGGLHGMDSQTANMCLDFRSKTVLRPSKRKRRSPDSFRQQMS